MGSPAARVGDITSHGGTIVSGSSNVFINGMPAANALSMHVCPMVTPGTPPIPHIGMLAVPTRALTVLINGLPAVVMGDMFLCVGPPATVVLGSFNVLIGMNPGEGGAGGGVGKQLAALARALSAGKISPVKGTETYPLDIQTAALVMQKYHTPEQFELDLKLLALIVQQRALVGDEDEDKEKKKRRKLTLKDFAEIFEEIEREQGYEAARYYACVGVDYDRLTDIAKSFVEGRDTNPDNNPNIMPTRFMLLYGADDSKLKTIDKHPDNFEGAPEHKINVSNLRKGLRLLGANIPEKGPYDNNVWMAHVQYMNRFSEWEVITDTIHIVEEGETLGSIARKYGLPTWKYLYKINKEKIGDNPAMLKHGIELQIPRWDNTRWVEKISARGGNPAYYCHGRRYRYPWVPFSGTILDEKGNVLKKQGKENKLKCEIYDSESGNLLASLTIENAGKLEMLLPDSRKMEIKVDGVAYDVLG